MLYTRLDHNTWKLCLLVGWFKKISGATPGCTTSGSKNMQATLKVPWDRLLSEMGGEAPLDRSGLRNRTASFMEQCWYAAQTRTSLLSSAPCQVKVHGGLVTPSQCLFIPLVVHPGVAPDFSLKTTPMSRHTFYVLWPNLVQRADREILGGNQQIFTTSVWKW